MMYTYHMRGKCVTFLLGGKRKKKKPTVYFYSVNRTSKTVECLGDHFLPSGHQTNFTWCLQL